MRENLAAQLQPDDGSHSGAARWPVAWSVNVEMLERERLRRGWTRAHLARLAHVDPRTVCSLVVGRRRPSLGTVQALCTALGLLPAEAIMFRERREEEGGPSRKGTGGGQQPRNGQTAVSAAADDIRARRGQERRAWARSSSHLARPMNLAPAAGA